MKKETSDIEITSQPEAVETGLKPVSTEFNILNWLCHHASQIAKGGVALLGLAALGGLGFLAKGVFSGTKKTDATVPEVNANATDERSIVARESAGIAAKSEDLAGFIAETKIGVMNIEIPKNQAQVADKKNEKIDFGDAAKEIEEIVTHGVKRSLMQNMEASSQSTAGTTVNNLVVNGAIPDQLIQIGYPWSGSINITELFGGQVNITGFSQVGNQPLPDWLQTTLEIISVSGLSANGVTVRGNLAYVAGVGLEIIDISNSVNPVLIGVSGFNAYGVTVKENLAYVAAYEGLKIIDISNSTNPALIGCISGFVAYEVVTVGSNFAYIAAYEGLKIIDISNKTNPFLMSGVSGFVANGVIVSGNLAYIATDEGLQIIDISDNACPSLNFDASGFSGKGITVSGNLAYIAADEGLEIIDLSQWQLSGTPIQSKCFYPLAINVQNSHGSLMKIFNVRTDNFPCVVGSIPNQSLNPGSTFSFYIKMTSIFNDPDKTDTLSLAINPHSAWLTFGINPFFMAKKTNFYSSSIASDVTIKGNFAYVSYISYNINRGGLKIIDVSQPTKPIIVGEVSGIILTSVTLQENKIYAVGDCFSIFDVTNYQFSGTPANSDAGNYNIAVIVTDPDGAKAQTNFTIRVEGGPRLNSTIPPQIALIGQSANFFLDQGTFYDPNEDVITYSASLANGGKLPYFLSFNPSSATFSGIPTSWDKGNYMVTIFASDRIVYPATPANFVLTVQDPIADQTFIVGRNTSCVLAIPPDTTFNGRSLVYSVKPRNSAGMPQWMYFNAANRTLFAAPNAINVGITSMQVMLNDGYGEAFFLFSLNVKFDTPPILGSMISTQTAEADKFFQFALPGGTFTDADGDTLSYSVNLGGASWLKFDFSTQTFSGTPSGWSDAYPYVARKYTITVTAIDPSNKAATGAFELNLNGPSSWEILINASIAVLGALIATYGYTQKKYLLWDFFKKEKYMKPIELFTVGATEFFHRISFPAEHIKSIIVTLSRDRSCAQNMSPCLRKTLGFFPGVKDTEERIFLYSGVSAYLFPWLFYDSEENVLKSVKGGPTEEFVGKDIKIQVRGTDNRIMEEFHIKVKSQLDEVADEAARAAPSSKAKHKKDTVGLGEPLISPIAANDL